MSDVLLRSVVVMDTVVTIQVVGHGDDAGKRRERAERVDAAVEWFMRIESSCSRFEEASEVTRLASSAGRPVIVSEALYRAVEFALALAEDTGGAFDPTVGFRLQRLGFDTEHRTGRRISTPAADAGGATYRDVALDPQRRTITLARPLMLDLGAVAKGLAADMAAQELRCLEDFAIDAGGDLYFSGRNPTGSPWSVGLQHPRDRGRLIECLTITNAAVCTSGDYARRSTVDDRRHHIIDARDTNAVSSLASVTVVAPTAMVADALATAAFVLGPEEGASLLRRHGVGGVLFTRSLERVVVEGEDATFAMHPAPAGRA